MRSSRAAQFACLALIPCYWIAALWPFVPEPPTWRQNTIHFGADGARFVKGSRLVSDGAAIIRAAKQFAAMDIELSIAPAAQPLGGPARVLEIGTNHERANLTIGQDGKDLVVRVRRGGADPSGTPALVLPGLLPPVDASNSFVDLSIRITASACRAEVQPSGARAQLEIEDAFSTWDANATLILGDSPVGEREWHGTIRAARIRVGEQLFDLLDGRTMEAPARIARFPARLRRVLDRYGLPPLDGWEVLVNVLGFVPLGWLAVIGGWRIASAVLLGLCVSLSMEIAQIFFAERIPAIPDLIANCLGAWIGAFAGHRSRLGSPTRERSS